MTTRHRRKLVHFFAPKQQFADARYGLHPLDNTRDEILPGGAALRGTAAFGSARDESGAPVRQRHREAAADDPWLSPMRSPVVRECLIKIAAAELHTVFDTPIETFMDLRGFCEDAELTERQTEVVVLTGEGWSQRAIAQWLEVSQPTVWEHLRTARHRLVGRLPLVVVWRLDTLSAGV